MQPPPAWLYELVSVLHRRRATVITLNYDVLIEAAVQTHEIWDPESASASSQATSCETFRRCPT
jgi:hypothetical protein